MKIVTYIVIGLLVVALSGGAYFFLSVHKPMAVDYEKLKRDQPDFEKDRKELTKFRDREKQETAWIASAIAALRKGLENDINAGKAEVTTAGNRIVINISEGVLYTPMSVTFAKNSKPALDNLAALLKDLKDKEILIGNMTQAAPAQGKGRKRVPAKDARALAAARSAELVKHLEKNGVPVDTLIALSYPVRQPERGFKIKEKKTVIVIAAPAMAVQETAAPKQETKSAPAAKPTATSAGTAPQPKSIPISAVPPKKVP